MTPPPTTDSRRSRGTKAFAPNHRPPCKRGRESNSLQKALAERSHKLSAVTSGPEGPPPRPLLVICNYLPLPNCQRTNERPRGTSGRLNPANRQQLSTLAGTALLAGSRCTPVECSGSRPYKLSSGGRWGDSNPRPSRCKRDALPLSYIPGSTATPFPDVGVLGFEPRTSALSELRSSQLSYTPPSCRPGKQKKPNRVGFGSIQPRFPG